MTFPSSKHCIFCFLWRNRCFPNSTSPNFCFPLFRIYIIIGKRHIILFWGHIHIKRSIFWNVNIAHTIFTVWIMFKRFVIAPAVSIHPKYNFVQILVYFKITNWFYCKHFFCFNYLSRTIWELISKACRIGLTKIINRCNIGRWVWPI